MTTPNRMEWTSTEPPLTRLEYFAGLIMAALVGNGEPSDPAPDAVWYAKALIAELDKAQVTKEER